MRNSFEHVRVVCEHSGTKKPTEVRLKRLQSETRGANAYARGTGTETAACRIGNKTSKGTKAKRHWSFSVVTADVAPQIQRAEFSSRNREIEGEKAKSACQVFAVCGGRRRSKARSQTRLYCCYCARAVSKGVGWRQSRRQKMRLRAGGNRTPPAEYARDALSTRAAPVCIVPRVVLPFRRFFCNRKIRAINPGAATRAAVVKYRQRGRNEIFYSFPRTPPPPAPRRFTTPRTRQIRYVQELHSKQLREV